MKGVVITGGKAPPAELIRWIVAQSDLCVAADSGLETALDAGIVPDYAVGDMDSISDVSMIGLLPPDRVRRAPRDKDETDTELSLGLLAEMGCSERVIVGGSGGRLDHLFALRTLFESSAPPTLWAGDESLVVGIGSRFPYVEATLDAIAEDINLSVFPCGTGPFRVSSTGLFWPIDGLEWEKGAFSLSNRNTGTRCSVRVDLGSFLLVLPVSASRKITLH